MGYEVPTGKEVFINPSHLIVTGMTQQSGKSTTVEALLSRSGFRSIVFKTKIGEKSFTEGTAVAPFFRDRSDFDFVRSLIEAYSKEKLTIEKGTLMTLCKGTKNLVDIKKRVDDRLAETKPLRGIDKEIYVRLQHYLGELLPQIAYSNFTNTLNITDGINIMNLERLEESAQSLVIQAVADEVLKTCNNVVLVVPEAWKFLPQKYNNPCKRVVESYIRQGATNNNFIWLDSQDMAGVDKIPLKQISTWILGYQAERNEVKHTLDQISLPKASKPKEDEIMNLGIGTFFLADREGVAKVYVQPSWVEDDKAHAVATGAADASINTHSRPLPSINRPVAQPKQNGNAPEITFATKKDINDIRNDFFNKIEQIVEDVNNAIQNFQPAPAQQINVDDIVGLVLQKMPARQIGSPAAAPAVDTEAIVKLVLSRIPASPGSVTYTVSPLEMIKQGFLKEAKEKILADVATLSPDAKKTLKFIESQGKAMTNNYIVEKCFFGDGTNSSHRAKVSTAVKPLMDFGFVEKSDKNGNKPGLKKRIQDLCGTHEAKEQDIDNLYNHILAELL